MKKFITVILLALVPILMLADPPKKISLTYTKEGNKLKIVALHSTKNINKHYIKTFVVSVNGKEVKTIDFTSQLNDKTQETEVTIPEIKTGCTVSVKGTCNKFGSKTTSIKL